VRGFKQNYFEFLLSAESAFTLLTAIVGMAIIAAVMGRGLALILLKFR
jgi:hypothetical protein